VATGHPWGIPRLLAFEREQNLMLQIFSFYPDNQENEMLPKMAHSDD